MLPSRRQKQRSRDLAMADTRPNLIDLPDELLQMIFLDVDKKDLKNLRLTHNHLNNVSTAPLFEEIVLLPMRGCLEGFAFFLDTSPQLSACVKTIHYNEVWHNYFEYHDETENWPGAKDDLLPPARSMGEEFELLRSIFRLLPEMRNAHVQGQGCGFTSYESPLDYPPKYLQRVFGLPAPNMDIDPEAGMHIHPRRQGSTAVFAALAHADSRLTSFTGIGFNPGKLMDRDAESAPSSSAEKMLGLAKGLKHLDVSFGHHIDSLESFPACFATFMRAAPNLVSVMLDFNYSCEVDAEFIDELPDDPTRIMRSLNSLDMKFASLKAFGLKNAICKQEDLEGFLFRYGRTLQSLYLQDLALTRTASTFSCGVRLLENIRDDLNLRYFKMMGQLNNTGEQDLHFHPEPPWCPSFYCNLKRETSRWITGKSEKIPEVLRLVAIESGRDDFEAPDMTQAELAETGISDIIPHLRRFPFQEELEGWPSEDGAHTYPNFSDQDPIDQLADEMAAALGGIVPEEEPDSDEEDFTTRFLQTYPDFIGTCSDEEFDRMVDAMDAAAPAGIIEEDSDDGSYYSDSGDM